MLKYDHEEIIRLYKSGLSYRQVCDQIGCSPAQVNYILHKHGEPKRDVLDSLRKAVTEKRTGLQKACHQKPIMSDKNLLLEEYKTKSISQISKEHHVDKRLISAKLRKLGVPIKRWSKKTHQARRKKFNDKYPKSNNAIWLRKEYIDNMRPINDMASELNCSVTAIRNRLKENNIPIRPPKRYGDKGQIIKTSRGIIVNYCSPKIGRQIRFRSLMECSYALYLDLDEDVISWDYEVTRLVYFDGFIGKQRTYICDFRVIRRNYVENIEVKPLSQQRPLDKYLYAKNCIKGWRWTTAEELEQSDRLFKSGYNSDGIEFVNKFPNRKYYNYWSKDRVINIASGWRKLSINRFGVYFKHRLINDNKIIDKPNKETIKTKKTNQGTNVTLDLDVILAMIKEDKKLCEIAEQLEVDPRTINNFLEQRSYVVRWGTSRRRSFIRFATKRIWPPEGDEEKEYKPKKIYKWDNYRWLYEHYISKHLSTRAIGKLVGKSGRLIGKKLRLHGIEIRQTCNQ